jgi:hypothetical protein
MVAITLADFLLDKFGGDSLDETRDNVARYRERIGRAPEAPVPGGRRRAGIGAGPTGADEVRTADEVGSGGDD